MAERSTTIDDLRGAIVHFKAGDVIVPPADELLMKLFGGDIMSGRVVDETQAGSPSDRFLAVSIANLDEPVIVSRSKLVEVTGGDR